MESLDRLLAEIKAEYTGSRSNAETDQQPLINSSDRSTPAIALEGGWQRSEASAIANQELVQVKAEFEDRDRTEAALQEQQRQTEAWRQQQLQYQQQQNLKEQATAWLKKLEPLSEEGLWFEEFACHFSSKLEAAIEYLQTVQSLP